MAVTNPEAEAQERASQNTAVTGVDIVEKDNEILDTNVGQLPATPTVTTKTADETGLDVTVPTASKPDLGNIDAIEGVAEDVASMDKMEGATGSFTGAIDPEKVQGTVSPDAVAEAVTEELDPKATTQYQLGELMKSIEDGKPLPAWASPAVRRVSAVMASRGMGSSSMASAAMIQAIMESGVPIAKADADKYATIQLTNLSSKNKAALQNAMTYAQMDQANLSARLQSAVTNAQGFLQIDLKNVDNLQAANTMNYQANLQALFKDAAEENARKQFNAKNEVQVEEFFAELGSQVDAANKNRTANMRQYNTSQENAMEQFKVQTQDARDKFNANMKFAIDQSNAQWRREINTANTATQNETNRINATQAFGASQAAMNFLWQKMRDNAAFNFQAGQSQLQKQHEVGLLAMEFANTEKLYTKEQKDLVGVKIGEWLANWITSTDD